jgi:hypothetical protein
LGGELIAQIIKNIYLGAVGLYFIGNFSIILLVGPMLEESYGSRYLVIMMVITAFATGVLNCYVMCQPVLPIIFYILSKSSFFSSDVINVSNSLIKYSFFPIIYLYRCFRQNISRKVSASVRCIKQNSDRHFCVFRSFGRSIGLSPK